MYIFKYFSRSIAAFRLAVVLVALWGVARGYWDRGTTTERGVSEDTLPRQSFFRWQWTASLHIPKRFLGNWTDLLHRKGLCVMAAFSMEFKTIGTGIILNRRVVLTSANVLEPWMLHLEKLRVWAVGKGGEFPQGVRYRIWRIRRLLPRSNNPEHWHGARGGHSPRHDLAIVHTMDRIYMYNEYHMHTHYMYPYRPTLTNKTTTMSTWFRITGMGYENFDHLRENYKIVYHVTHVDNLVDCSEFIPKWWGKFICVRNTLGTLGVPTGGGLFTGDDPEREYVLVGVGCFEIRYNEDRIMVFTDLRYYIDLIYLFSNYTPGDYYEYAYPQWGGQEHYWSTPGFWGWDSHHPINPIVELKHGFNYKNNFPLGR